MKKILHHIIRISLGLTFIFSAYLKLFPIEPFELFVFGNGIPYWDFSNIIARLIISMEFFIGLMLIINLYPKKIQQLNIIVLISFTLLLFYYTIFKPNMSNCNCFGEQIELTPINSLIKNLVLLIASLYIYITRIASKIKKQKSITILLFVVILILPPIITPPDFVYYGNLKKMNEPLDTTLLIGFKHNPKNISISKGKVIVCFFSTGCKFCKLASKKLSIIDDDFNNTIPILYVLLGDERKIDKFWQETESNRYPYLYLSVADFINLSGQSLPQIYFLENGIKKSKSGYRDFTQENIFDFFICK